VGGIIAAGADRPVSPRPRVPRSTRHASHRSTPRPYSAATLGCGTGSSRRVDDPVSGGKNGASHGFAALACGVPKGSVRCTVVAAYRWSIQVDLSHVGRVPVSRRFGPRQGPWPGPGAEWDGIVPGPDRFEEEDLLFGILRASQVDDRPGADVSLEPGHVARVDLVPRRAPEQAPPRDGAVVARPVAAKVSEVGNRFEQNVSHSRRTSAPAAASSSQAFTVMASML